MMAAQMSEDRQVVEFMPTARPWMIVVAGPVCEAFDDRAAPGFLKVAV